MQSRANPSLPRIPVNREKYREILPILIPRAFKSLDSIGIPRFSLVPAPIHNRERTERKQGTKQGFKCGTKTHYSFVEMTNSRVSAPQIVQG